jgi:hypothetical protein
MLAISVSKSIAMIFARAGRRFFKPIKCDSMRYLDVTLHTPLTWSALVAQVRKKTA